MLTSTKKRLSFSSAIETAVSTCVGRLGRSIAAPLPTSASSLRSEPSAYHAVPGRDDSVTPCPRREAARLPLPRKVRRPRPPPSSLAPVRLMPAALRTTVSLPRVNRTQEQEAAHDSLDRFLATLDSEAAHLRASTSAPPSSLPRTPRLAEEPGSEGESERGAEGDIAIEAVERYAVEARSGHLIHPVRKGDSWEKLAVAFGVTVRGTRASRAERVQVQAIQRANRMWPSDPIFLKARLVIPRTKVDVLSWRRAQERERSEKLSAKCGATCGISVAH